ncbi:ABC transporter permease [Microvirga sp. G4-2]|uniref:ABC transporter permease n=1 Tax=Microvirga sp. G4-2 TaxID=3434467 RepID=UPI004043D528
MNSQNPTPITDLETGEPIRYRNALIPLSFVSAFGVLGATAVLIAGMKLHNPAFGSLEQLIAILVTAIFLVVASFGQGLVILIGGIDLSIGVTMGVGGMMIANLTHGSNDTLAYALPAALLCCTVIGAINGVGIGIAKLPPFIMTLSSGTTFFGIALGLTAGSSQQSVAPALQEFMNGRWLGIPYPIFFMVLFVAIAVLFQNRTAMGRKLYAMGSSPGAARVLGLPIVALTVTVYAISGLCAGITGVLLAGYSSSATLDMGNALLMPTIAAVVIGGARVTGGAGLYIGTFAGALFLSTLSTVITALSLSQGFRSIVQGVIIIIALVFQGKHLIGGKR